MVCDTIGQAMPTQVTDLIAGLQARHPQRRIVFHGHDTWGLGVANTLAAIDAGATMVDGSLGGLGGCPFAPGASGNTSTEDLLFATRPDWFTLTRWRRWWTSPTSCSPNSASPTGPGPLRAHGRRPRHSTGSSATIAAPDRGYIHVMASDNAASSKQQPLLVLGKITEILDAFSLTQPDMTLGEIQQATGLPTSTVQRLVSNMVAQGLLDRKGDRIRVGVRMSYWAATALKDLDVLAVINPVLKEIRDKTGETACFFKVEQRLRVCVAVRDSPRTTSRHVRGQGDPTTCRLRVTDLARVEPRPCGENSSAPLEPLTDGTVTSPDDLRGSSRRPRPTAMRSQQVNVKTRRPASPRRSSTPPVTSSAH